MNNVVPSPAPHNHDHYANALIRRVLDETKVIAMVGASAIWKRPSYFAM